MNKRALTFVKYLLVASIFLGIIVLTVFGLAAHVVRTSDGAVAYNINEDVGYIYNISVNNTNEGQTANVTQVNITLPENFTFVIINGTSASDVEFTNTSGILAWSNLTGGIVVNGSNTTRYFWFNATVSFPGVYNVSVTVTNASTTTYSNITVTINDTTAPHLTYFVSPSVSNLANLSQSSIPVNVSVVDAYSNINIVRIYLYNITGLVNNTNVTATASLNSTVYLNFTGLANGRYYINITANESAGNQNLTGASRTVVLDTVAPNITHAGSATTTGNYSQNWILINVTIDDTGLAGIYSMNVTLYNATWQARNSTLVVDSSNYTINITAISDGLYYLNVTANDTANNVNRSRQTILLDTTAPLISYGTGTEASVAYLGATNIYVNVSATETNEKNITFDLFNASALVNSTTFAAGTREINWTNLSAGNYNYSVTIRDYTGHSNTTAPRIAYLKNYWVMNGTTYDTLGSVLNNTIVNITVWNMGQQGPTLNFSVSTTSNASGWFSLNVPKDSNWMYRPVIRHFNNSTTSAIDYTGQSLPQFPYNEFVNMTGLNFYLRDAGTINITAINGTGARTSFNYMVKDTSLGYDVASNWQTYVSEAIVYVPRDRNYSIMVYPNRSMPVSFNWNNFTTNATYNITNGLSVYNVTTRTAQKTFNLTETLAIISGFAINASGWGNWTEFKVIAFLLEPGNMISKDYGALPYNISAWNQTAYSDTYTLTSGAYSITVPASAETSNYLLFATARNGTGYYGGYKNISLTYGDSATNVNFTMYPLMSTSWGNANNASGNFSIYNNSGGTVSIPSAQQAINVVNVSNVTLSNLQAHIETTVDYSNYNATQFTFMSSISSGSNSTFYLPLLNVTGIKEMNIFTQGSAPKRTSLSVAEIIQNNNVTLRAFDPGAIDDTIPAGSINIALYISNATCDVPSPASSCIARSSQNMGSFNPLSAIIGGGKISFRMGYGDIGVHYVDVDMLASGPPDALFDSAATTRTSGGFDSALRFGSSGPKIYNHVLVSIPYTEGSSSQTGLNESAPVNMSVPVFYDESWRVIWNASTNGTNASAFAGNYSYYSQTSTDWQNLMSNSTCTTNVTVFNATTPCYIDTTYNKIWVRLPHFSGTGPKATGSVITASSSTTTPSPGGGGEDLPFWTSTIYKDNQELSVAVISQELGAKERVIIKINSLQHTVGVVNLTSNSAVINVSSVSQQATLLLRESKKFDVDANSYYDLKVTLNSIANNKANLTIESINERVVAPGGGQPSDRNISDVSGGGAAGTPAGDGEGNEEADEANKIWIWVVIFIVVVMIVVIVIVLLSQRHSTLKRVGLRD